MNTTTSYKKIHESIDALVKAFDSERVSYLLQTIHSSLDPDCTDIINSADAFLVFNLSVTCKVKIQSIRKGKLREDTQARMMLFHALHRKYGCSIKEISDLYDGLSKGSVHRMVAKMDGYLESPEYFQDVIEIYDKVVAKTNALIQCTKNIET